MAKRNGEHKVAGAASPIVCDERIPCESAGYAARHVAIDLSHDEAKRLKHFAARFAEQGAMLVNGKPVKTQADAIRYIIQQSTIRRKTDKADE